MTRKTAHPDHRLQSQVKHLVTTTFYTHGKIIHNTPQTYHFHIPRVHQVGFVAQNVPNLNMFVSWRGDHASFNLAAEGQPCRNSKGVRRGFYSTVITVSFQEHKERKAPLGWAKTQSLSVTQLSSWLPPERKWFWDDDEKKPTTSFPTFLWYVWIMSRNAFIFSQMTHFQEKKSHFLLQKKSLSRV